MPTYLQGLTIGLAYVAPIGMQNLFVINSALTQPRRRTTSTPSTAQARRSSSSGTPTTTCGSRLNPTCT